MLQIRNAHKEYKVGDFSQMALSDVSVNFRNSEFVSILGPSGSGKTTLLNIIGGLDSYDSGDLVINGISTKDYKDRDWDTYRNHTIGFVFQSYNLIAHQSVLKNVELALTISGLSKSQRKKRAKEALERVGLSDHIGKKPNQLSGGQMQRVAIARALVNNPDILLADEPTGALDTETSVQIMELLKEVANDRLVVMVTHNSELAEQYSSRIVKLKDGKIAGDTNEFLPAENLDFAQDTKKEKPAVPAKKAKMSIFTSLLLSFNNLATKKRRTLLTSFAGSIGIIGIALILSLSTGVNAYIEALQRDTMSAYPITITAEALNMQGMMQGAMDEFLEVPNTDGVHSDFDSLEMNASMTVENNLTDFKKHLDDPNSDISEYLGETGVIYSYDASFDIFTYDSEGTLVNTDTDPEALFESSIPSVGGPDMFMSMMSGSSATTAGAENFEELMSGGENAAVNSVITDNYNLLYGKWPENYDEVVLFLDDNNSVPVDTLYLLGLITADEYVDIAESIEDDEVVSVIVWDYDEITEHSFYMAVTANRYKENDDGTFRYQSDDFYSSSEDDLKENTELKIVGIVKPNEDATGTLISGSVGYTSKLTEYVIEKTDESDVIKAQQDSEDVNVLTGLGFDAASDEQKVEDTKEYISAMGISEKAALYSTIIYSSSAADGDSAGSSGTTSQPSQMPGSTGAGSAGGADEVTLAAMMDSWLENDPDEEVLIAIYDESIGGNSYDDNMASFGKISYDAPTAINIYTDSFEDKDAVATAIEQYNTTADKENQIIYTDYVEMMTSSMTSIIDVISYVLIAFVSVSLIVSCIMIGIITHISVMERTKEIGILRALGASKRNISQVFNAETMIIGLCSGLLGVGIASLLNIPITAIVRMLTGDSAVASSLPAISAVILVAISVVITIIGGLIPARSAAKKDPVIALRTE